MSWTVLRPDGTAASGRNVPALSSGVGRYYAQWSGAVAQGTYSVVWSVVDSPGAPAYERVQSFVVVDRANYPGSGAATITRGVTGAVGVYLTGSSLGRGDLPLFLRNQDGFLTDAYAVYWSVSDPAGRRVVARSSASRASSGEYYAPWIVTSSTGEYVVRWEWLDAPASPLQARDLQASVVCPFALPIPGIVSASSASAPNIVRSGASCAYTPVLSSSVPMPAAAFPVEVRATLSENGGASDSVTVPHSFGSAPSVYVLKRSAGSWLDAVGTVDVIHDAGFATVTVVNTTDISLEVLVRLSGN